MAKIGRPLEKGVPRSEKVEIRLTSEEKETLRLAAEKRGVTISDFMRNVAVEMAGAIATEKQASEVYDAVVRGAGKVSPDVVVYSGSAEFYEELRNRIEGED